MKRIVTGILAHVDSGKTTLSEGLLYHSGHLRTLGRVDHGNAFLDTDEIEREKGITIFSKQAVLNTRNSEFILLDTPGHIDFSSEMERTLSVLDYAILVISGTDGVQNHTQTLWKLLIRYNIPVFIFINKMDISQKTKQELLDELKDLLDDKCIDFTDTNSDEFNENIAVCDETLMEEYLSVEKVTGQSIINAIKKRNVFPCLFGSALKLENVDLFLDLIDKFTAEPEYKADFGAKVFKITEDNQGVRLTHMKITGGSLPVKSIINVNSPKGEIFPEKVDRIRIYSGEKFTSADIAYPGMVIAVAGLTHSYPGQGLGTEKNSAVPFLEPVLTYAINPIDGTDIHTALMYLKKLEEEEPQLHIIWNEQLSQIHIQLMGEVQLEVLKRIIKSRFNMEIEFGKGNIAYRETIKNKVEGVGHFEPLRHYAEVHLILEPLPRGKGIQFATNCSEDILDKNWQRLILTHLNEKTHIGVLTGSPVTDIKITLVTGKAHKKHTEGGDFRQATYRAVRNGLMQAESILLEPQYSFRLEVPTENVGRAMTDIQNMGGEFSSPHTSGNMSIITGTAPVSKMQDYMKDVTAYTAGNGKLFCNISGYTPCHNSDEVIENIGYNPENDTDNPCGSVFCAHGSGFTVKWDEVKDYMHLEGVLEKKSYSPQDTSERISNYVSSVINDEELLRIFEKTYGPVKVKNYNAVTPRRTVTQQKTHTKKPIQRSSTHYLLVDGYNIIFAWDELKKAAEQSLDLARELLIQKLCNYRGYTGVELILVFDAYKVKGNPGEVEEVHNISVVYTKEAETADAYIEKVTHELAKKHHVRVATSDNLEQLIILGNGAIRVSASAFEKEVNDAENEIRRFINQTF